MTGPALSHATPVRERRLREEAIDRLALWIARFVGAMAVVSLVGWLIDRPWIVGVGTFPAGMRASAALAGVLLAISVLLLRRGRSLRPRMAGAVLDASVAALAVVSVAHALDQTLILNRYEPMSLLGVASVLFMAAAVEVRRWWPRRRGLSDTLAAVAFSIGLVALVAQLVADAPLPMVPDAWPRLVPSTVLVVGLAVAVLLERPDEGGVAGLVAAGGVAGRAIRILLPLALLLPASFEVLHARATQAGVVRPEVGSMLLVAAFTIVLTLLVLYGTSRLREHELALAQTRETSFLSVLSHELRTPLIAIRNLGEIVYDRWDELEDHQKRRALHTTAEQSKRLLALIQDAVMRARLEAGELPNHPDDVLLRDHIFDGLRDHDLEVVVQCPDDLAAHIDPDHLRLMLSACLEQAARCSADPVTIVARSAGSDARLEVEHAAEAEHSPNGGASGAAAPPDLWTVAELARLSGGDASYERLDEGRARFVVLIPQGYCAEQAG